MSTRSRVTVFGRTAGARISRIGVQGPPGTDGSGGPPTTLTYSAAGTYNLPSDPASPATTRVFVNGVKQVYGIDYTIANTVLSWVSPNLTLASTDIIEIYI